ncbi:hypothetical protein HanIR_Chr04g0178061 [Helianthus annuus]|nr:hypothetical protein HanIR_Chr04g0178061 [Helianthus annuus]
MKLLQVVLLFVIQLLLIKDVLCFAMNMKFTFFFFFFFEWLSGTHLDEVPPPRCLFFCDEDEV